MGTPAYTDPTPFNFAAAATFMPAGGFSTFTLTTPFPVVAGNSYTFLLTSGSSFSLAAQSGSPYGQGQAISNYASPAAFAFDAAFQVFETAVVPAAAPIPTLSEWALIVLSVLVAAITAFKLRGSAFRN